jgi:hypothetical protein
MINSLTPYLRLKRSGHETDHTPPSNAEVKNQWSYIYILPNKAWRESESLTFLLDKFFNGNVVEPSMETC